MKRERLNSAQFATKEDAIREAQKEANYFGKTIWVQRVAKKDGTEAYSLRFYPAHSDTKNVASVS